MILLRFPGSILLHLFFGAGVVLHILSLVNGDFTHECQGSHILQLFSYAAAWILLFLPVKGRKFLFPLAALFPWIEHVRMLFQYFLDPTTKAFWICLLVALLLPYLAWLQFKRDVTTT